MINIGYTKDQTLQAALQAWHASHLQYVMNTIIKSATHDTPRGNQIDGCQAFVALQLIWFSSLQSRQTAQLHNKWTLLFTQGDFVATYMLKCPHHQAPRFTVSTLEGHMHSKNHRRVTLMCPSCGTCVLYCISEFLYPSIHPFLCLTETLCQNFPKCTIAWIVYLTTVSVLLTCASSLLYSGCCNTYTCRLYCYCIVVSHMNSWWMSECSM